MKQLTLFSFLLVALLFNACKDDDQPHNDCFTEPNRIGLNLTILEGPTISLPAKISVFFKVQDDNGNPVGFLTEENFLIYEKGLNDACPAESSACVRARGGEAPSVAPSQSRVTDSLESMDHRVT
ncbi:MAG: hypothetical protein AAB316_11865, partial [Bacteroidota bacterium]